MGAPDLVTISNGALTARISPLGAELWSLTNAQGREYMTDADPAFWTGHAPLLFPIVGALRNGSYRLDGRAYTLPKHGFTRTSMFELAEHEARLDELREREDLALRIAEERPMAVLLAILSQAALECDGNVCVTSLVLAPAAAQKQAAAPRRVLQLEGLGVDNLSVARFAAALRDANVFADVRLKSSIETRVADADAVSYKLDCAW